MDMNFYYLLCLSILVSYQRLICEINCIDSIINYLRLFNLKNIDVMNNEEIEI